MANKILPSIAPKPTVFPPTTGCDNCENYLYQLEELEEEVEQVQLDLDSLTDEVDSIPRITVDSQISDSSTNPVQNRVISEALEDKQDVLIEGDGIDVASDSTISLKPATTSTLGGIKVGNGLVVASDGTLSSTGGSGGGGVADVQMNGTSIVTNDVAKVTNDNGDMVISGTFTSGGKITSGGRIVLPHNTYFAAKDANNNEQGMFFFNSGTEYFGNANYSTVIRGSSVTTASEFTIANHSSPVGTQYAGDFTRSLQSGGSNSWDWGSWGYELGEGTWSLSCSGVFAPNTTGFRRLCWAFGDNDTPTIMSRSVRELPPVAYSGYETRFDSNIIVTFTGTRRWVIGADQVNTGGNRINCTIYWSLTRLV